MTPTSPLAGLLLGLGDGAVVVALVLLLSYLYGRRHSATEIPVQHPVAADHAPKIAGLPSPTDIRRAA